MIRRQQTVNLLTLLLAHFFAILHSRNCDVQRHVDSGSKYGSGPWSSSCFINADGPSTFRPEAPRDPIKPLLLDALSRHPPNHEMFEPELLNVADFFCFVSPFDLKQAALAVGLSEAMDQR